MKDTGVENIRLWWQWLRRAPQTFIGTEWKDLRSVSEAHSHGPITNNFYEATDMRNLFTTSRGRFGTENATIDHPIYHHMEVKVGDKVRVPLGSKIPILLRPVVDSISRGSLQGEHLSSKNHMACHHGTEQVYHLVGTCYVDGIMDGEAMDDNTLNKAHIFSH